MKNSRVLNQTADRCLDFYVNWKDKHNWSKYRMEEAKELGDVKWKEVTR